MVNEKQIDRVSITDRLGQLFKGFAQLIQLPDVGRFQARPFEYDPPTEAIGKLRNGATVSKNAMMMPSQVVPANNPVMFREITKPVVSIDDRRIVTLLSTDILASMPKNPSGESDDYILGDVMIEGIGRIKMCKLYLFDECVSRIPYPPYNEENNIVFVASAFQILQLNPELTPFRIELELEEGEKPTVTMSVMMIYTYDACVALQRLSLCGTPRNATEIEVKTQRDKMMKFDSTSTGVMLKTTMCDEIKLIVDGSKLTFTATADQPYFAGILIYDKELFDRGINKVHFLGSVTPGYICKGQPELNQLTYFHTVKGDPIAAYKCSLLPLRASDEIVFEMKGDQSFAQTEYIAYLLYCDLFNLSIKGVVRI